MNKTLRQRKEYNLKLDRHEFYKSELTNLVNGSKWTYTLLDGIKFKDKNCLTSDKIQTYTYLARKIENTDPMKPYTAKPITKPIAKPIRKPDVYDSGIKDKDRYVVLDSDSDSDSD
jgi:hypothetical protein